jgi:hypothetical protein
VLGKDAADVAGDIKGRRDKGKKLKPNSNSHLSISMWVPSMDIIRFSGDNGIVLKFFNEIIFLERL